MSPELIKELYLGSQLLSSVMSSMSASQDMGDEDVSC